MSFKRAYISLGLVILMALVGSAVMAFELNAQGGTATPQATASSVAGESDAAEIDLQPACSWVTDSITVNGAGKVTVPADVGVVDLGVEVIASTVKDARTQAASSMRKVLTAVKAKGIADKDITTTEFSIWPETTWVEEPIDLGGGRVVRGGRSVVIGYRVSNQVSIKVNDLEKLADVIDDAALAGGDDARVSSVYFTAEDTSMALDNARKLAVADAKHRANLYASEFSVDLGTLISMSEDVGVDPYGGPVAFARAESLAAGPSTPLNSGEIEVEVNITAKFAITEPGCGDWFVPEPWIEERETGMIEGVGPRCQNG